MAWNPASALTVCPDSCWFAQGAVEFYGAHGKEVTHARALLDHARELVYDEANKDLIIRYAGWQETIAGIGNKSRKWSTKTLEVCPL